MFFVSIFSRIFIQIKELPIEITEKMSSFRLGKKRVSMKSNAVLAKVIVTFN